MVEKVLSFAAKEFPVSINNARSKDRTYFKILLQKVSYHNRPDDNQSNILYKKIYYNIIKLLNY